MKRLIWLPVAGFLLIAGAAVAAAAPSLADQARGVLGGEVQEDGGTITIGGARLGHPGHDLLVDVLADLVSDGTITQAQSDAITAALDDRVEAERAEMEARMELMRQMVSDGIITQEEIDQLPADDPLREAFDSIANDGQISIDQLRGLGPGFGFAFGHAELRGPGGRDHGGPGFWISPDPNDADPDASPSPDSSSN